MSTLTRTANPVAFKVRTDALRAAVDAMQSIVKKTQTIPVLGMLRLAAEPGQVTVTATDLDVALSMWVPASNVRTGVVLLSARLLADTLRLWPDAEVGISVPSGAPFDGACEIVGAGGTVHLATMPPSEFPLPTEVTGAPVATIDGGALQGLMRRTRYAITSEDTRYFLNGAKLECADGLVRAIATDGHRLVITTCRPITATEAACILHRKTMTQILALAPAAPVVVRANDRAVTFTCGNWTLTSRAIDANFPAYDRVIPKSNDKIAHVEASAWLAAAQRVLPFANERSQAVKHLFRTNTLTLSAGDNHERSVTVSVPIRYSGPDLDIVLNGRYVIDALDVSAATGAVQLDMKDDVGQIVLRANGAAHEYLAVIMPMRA